MTSLDVKYQLRKLPLKVLEMYQICLEVYEVIEYPVTKSRKNLEQIGHYSWKF